MVRRHNKWSSAFTEKRPEKFGGFFDKAGFELEMSSWCWVVHANAFRYQLNEVGIETDLAVDKVS